jgi:signal transduction histidine kinase
LNLAHNGRERPLFRWRYPPLLRDAFSVANPGEARRLPTFFLMLTVVFLVAAGWAVAWRATSPSDGTTVNVADMAVSPQALVVQDVIPGGPLRAGDEIRTIDGIPPADPLQGRIGAKPIPADRSLRYDVVRNGVPMTVDVVLHDFPLAANLLASWPSILVNAVLLLTAAAIFAARPGDAAAHAAILASAIAVATMAGSGYFQLQAVDLVAGNQFWRWYGGELCFAALWGAMLHFALAFPEVTERARFRWRVQAGYLLAIGSYAVAAAGTAAGTADPLTRLCVIGSPALVPMFLFPPIILAVLVRKYTRAQDLMLRRRLRWLATSLGGGVTVYVAVWALPAIVGGGPPVPLEYQTLAFLGVPLAVAMAILRHRALNIEVVISRSLVYGSLSVLLAGVYIVVVSLLSLTFPPVGQLWQEAVAAATIALAVQPVRARIQSVINTRFFGESSDPYRVVAVLASRLQTINTPGEQLRTVVETLGSALRLRYLAIELDRDTGSEKAASFGTPTALSHRLPLTHHGERVGQLVVAHDGTKGMLGRKERSVLAEVARHLGSVVYTARLTTDLIRSRDRLVHAREEERKHLLRELHDGVGPTLAAVTLGLHASRRAIGEATPAGTLLARLQDALADAITEVRRLARGLRPPALESLGLLGAIREHISTFGATSGGTEPKVVLETPAELPPLPAAVEVATYRIVCESLTNASRHADAGRCTVRLWVERDLRIEVTDDGSGLPARWNAGIGLSSMRERAAELGGGFHIERIETGGTRVSASLPLPPVPAGEGT